MLKTFLKTDTSPALLFIRAALGAVMFAHGAQKVLGWYGGAGFEKTIQLFTAKMQFPEWLALLVIFTEFFGSMALVVGLFTRIAALGIGLNMAVCASLNHVQHGFFMNWFGQQKGEGYEFHILVVGISLALLIKGGGMLSLDRALSRS